VPTVTCACGGLVDGPPGDAVCADCGAVLSIPGEPAAVESLRSRLTRYALAAALLPLLLSTFVKEDLESRVERMLHERPDLWPAVQAREFENLPDERIAGALHGRFTWAHWIYALLSATAFWLCIRTFWPMGNATSGQLWFLGVLVGTVGILLLLGFQWVALHSRGWIVGGAGAILVFVFQFIGYSYEAARNPANGLLPSMMGYTFGVGLCEELCKTLPLLIMARRQAALDARGLALLGLATGIGFGVGEGIMYSSDYYNGIFGGLIYVVRFVSCVALHAVWSAGSALMLWGTQAEIDGIDAWHEWPMPVVKIIGISMVLHGAYDTFLKRDLEILALLVAAASFVWFFRLYERVAADEDGLQPA